MACISAPVVLDCLCDLRSLCSVEKALCAAGRSPDWRALPRALKSLLIGLVLEEDDWLDDWVDEVLFWDCDGNSFCNAV